MVNPQLITFRRSGQNFIKIGESLIKIFKNYQIDPSLADPKFGLKIFCEHGTGRVVTSNLIGQKFDSELTEYDQNQLKHHEEIQNLPI